MNSNIYIFPIPEIEQMIIDYLDPYSDLYQLMSVNKYFLQLIKQTRKYKEMKKFKVEMKWFKPEPNDKDKYQFIFWMACDGFLFIVKYLLKKYPDKINVHYKREQAFKCACRQGHLEIAKYLYEYTSDGVKNKINIHIDNEFSFRWACYNGHLAIVKWLYDLEPMNKIDVHTNEETAFKWACEDGHLNVAKWLYQLNLTNKVDIRVNNDEIFKRSCLHGRLEVVKWLTTLCSDYHYEIINDEIKYRISS